MALVSGTASVSLLISTVLLRSVVCPLIPAMDKDIKAMFTLALYPLPSMSSTCTELIYLMCAELGFEFQVC